MVEEEKDVVGGRTKYLDPFTPLTCIIYATLFMHYLCS